MKALQRILSGKGGKPAAVARGAGVGPDDLAQGVVRYVLSSEYNDDLPEVLTRLGLDAAQILRAAEEVEYAWGQTSVVERLLAKVGPVLRQADASGVVSWTERLRRGDPLVLQAFWATFYPHLIALARKALRGAPRGISDEEDVAFSAFDSFVREVQQGHFPPLNDPDALRDLLLEIIKEEVTLLKRHQRRDTRGGGKDRLKRGLAAASTLTTDMNLIAGAEPTPEMAVQLADEWRRLLDAQSNETLRSVARLKLEGYTNEEIAGKLGRTVQMIERKWRVIRQLWAKR
jgi:DNA-directed RNA polymerase specialized sigma24 family protein